MISLQKFWEQYGKFPSSWNQKEAGLFILFLLYLFLFLDEFVKIASKIIESEMKSKVENLNVDLLKKISFTAQVFIMKEFLFLKIIKLGKSCMPHFLYWRCCCTRMFKSTFRKIYSPKSMGIYIFKKI